MRLAQTLALAIPALLLGGAYISEYVFGMHPCEMCWWQRWPHFAAVALALLSFAVPLRVLCTGLAALAMLVSGLIGLFHAGVEYGWWEGVTKCASIPHAGGGSAMDAILATPLIRCDTAQWTLLGVSLAGFNFIISCAAGIAALVLLARKR